MPRTKGKRPPRAPVQQVTVESAPQSPEEQSQIASPQDPYEVQDTPPPSKPPPNRRQARRPSGRGEPVPPRRPQGPSEITPRSSDPRDQTADPLAVSALSPGHRLVPLHIGTQLHQVGKGQGQASKVAEGAPETPSRQRGREAVGAATVPAQGRKRTQEAEGAATAPRSRRRKAAEEAVTTLRETQEPDEEVVVAVAELVSTQATTPRRRSFTATGPSAQKKKISPKKTTTMIIPGSQLPNGGKHPLPKGTVMEMIQVRDLEVSRLMEELQNYEDEAMVLTHQIHVMSNEKLELDMQIQEMAKSMADMQRAISHMRLSSAIGPRLTYWADEKIYTYWDRLVNNVLSFAEDHCHWAIEGGIDEMSQYRPDAWKLGGSEKAGHFGTFQHLMDEEDPSLLRKIGITQTYVRKLTSDGLGNSYPGRLDAFVGEEQPNELVPAAMIMKILQSEVFDKIRWLLRSEPFWDPMQNPNPASNVDWESFRGRMTNDFVVLQERTSAHDDPTAFEFNCIRAKMILHLMTQHDQLGTAMTNYMNRVGVLILNAIHPFITVDCIHHEKLGREKDDGTELLRFEELFRDDTPHAQRLGSKTKLHKILTGAWTLALLMRSDNTVTYLDGGGFNLPFDDRVMENIGAMSQNPALKFFRLSKDKERYATTKETFAWLVVAPCLKRAGKQDGTGYEESRVIAKSRMVLREVLRQS
ncbi:hypothetical protein L211DRAFT_853263 [Terfezia boudieri ATCC MYA-4762]|uniref:Uncharacterized protein n=1 Tax=Terfezia boudieri ATCC MYA-4762 TaxID=1051890 RepID=A0A3N4L8W2_9PEZI|nr:hypothetical protein L211DRAFT_853263 [Terfezia boudieri ATCC MYA-4762]